MSTLPEAIKVGHLDYRVESWPASEGYAASRAGECDRINRVIRVREDLPAKGKAETLLHEVLHAAYDFGDLADGDAEEKVVTVFASVLSTIWRDNPEFVRFMEASFDR